ncbi:MAG: hypothetical protein OXG15_06190, partial [Gammaproteobacteria bacterium]|nr:hypothetical protein [Gammaproteobacteria bacterium]
KMFQQDFPDAGTVAWNNTIPNASVAKKLAEFNANGITKMLNRHDINISEVTPHPKGNMKSDIDHPFS